MKTEAIKSQYPGAYDIAVKLAANPQRTTQQRIEADELRQEAARKGWSAMVTQVAVELAAAKGDGKHRVTACWMPGNSSTRAYDTMAEAMAAAKAVASDSLTAKWNANGALVAPAHGEGFWVRG